MDNPSQQKQPDHWLARVQEQSWEPEIIISGIVLFALYQIPELIGRLEHFLTNYSLPIFSAGSADEALVSLLMIANIWLIIGFTAHLFLRSVWVAYVGLSYVYKDGIRVSRLRLRERYNRLLFKDTGFLNNIVRLEEVCSTTFAVSFLLFMCVLGAFFFLAVVALLVSVLIKVFPEQRELPWLDPLLSGIALLFIIDFITLGWLKRIPYFSKVYYPVYRVMSWLTLSPLYRKIYYGLISNLPKWKAALGMISFILISGFMAFSIRTERNVADVLSLRLSKTAEQSMYSGHYENLMEGKPSNAIQIPSDVIKEHHLRVFVVHRSAFEDMYIKPLCDYEARKDSVDEDELKMECLDAFYDLKLDSQLVATDFAYFHNARTHQEGLLTYLDIGHLDKGGHTLTLVYNFYDEEGEYNDREVADVEFYKAVSTTKQ
jgi:hypothetical protein